MMMVNQNFYMDIQSPWSSLHAGWFEHPDLSRGGVGIGIFPLCSWMLGLGSRGPLNKRGEDEDNKSSVKYERRPVACSGITGSVRLRYWEWGNQYHNLVMPIHATRKKKKNETELKKSKILF